MELSERLKSGRLFFDGGCGTYFQSCGLGAGELPELWNISRPEAVVGLHTEYLRSGSDIICTNTFGANSLKFSGDNGMPPLDEIIAAAVENAKCAAGSFPEKKYIALDIGPTGRLLKPLGDLDFEAAVGIFAETVRIGVRCGVDLILIETMNDSYETKAAVLAAKENSRLPVFVTNAYDESGKLMTGASPAAMAAMLEGLRVDALGINCSFGPDKMQGIVSELLRCSSVPVIVNPNAGLPVFRNGKTEFELTPKEFADIMCGIASSGAAILGGCCGTTPEHIRAMVDAVRGIPYHLPEPKDMTVVSSYTHAVEFGARPVLIGERINPTGKPRLRDALRSKSYEYIMQEGISQQDAGADILDVNTGLPEIDEAELLSGSVAALQTVSDLPLQIDTSDPSAMAAALRIYNGKPLINSVSGKAEVMSAIFPLAAKYGGAVIALTLDEGGIPDTADGRIAIAEKIIAEAEKYGILKKDIIVDPLAMTVSSDAASASVTLECLSRLSELGIKTSLGVSNVSFGLPQRGIINSVFFTLAMHSGLSAAIMNPHSREMMNAYRGFCALSSLDPQFEEYIAYAAENAESEKPKENGIQASDAALSHAIIKGMKSDAAEFASALLKDTAALDIIDRCIIPALDEIGGAFESGKAFLPQLLMSAEAAKSAFDVIKAQLAAKGGEREKKLKIVIATVKGDIHDIGKNIVRVLLENYDFDVIDLGKDTPPELIADTAEMENAPLVGLSALMTTTVPAMEETIRLIREKCPSCRVVVGGAVLTREYADMIGADKYAKDAMETVRYAEQLWNGYSENQKD